MFVAQPDYLKNETRYSTKTLVGNWVEERLSFPLNNYHHHSSHQIDFETPHLHGFSAPDTILRKQNALKRLFGATEGKIIEHHGRKGDEDLITWYDEYYNKYPRQESDRLPELRSWNIGNMAWEPERSDYPMAGPPRNYGLYQQKKSAWKRQLQLQQEDEMNRFATTYTRSYDREVPLNAYPLRHRGTVKHMSSLLHSWNNIGHDAQYRNATNNYQKKQFPELLKAVPMRPHKQLTAINVIHSQPENSFKLGHCTVDNDVEQQRVGLTTAPAALSD